MNDTRYADDKMLLAGAGLQKLLDLTKVVTVKRGLEINTEKIKYIVNPKNSSWTKMRSWDKEEIE